MFVQLGDPNHTGNVAEAGFLFHATKAGVPVLLPTIEHAAYDAALDLGHRLIRVQIKSGRLADDGDVIVARLRRSRHTPLNGYVVGTYSASEVDAFGIYCEQTDGCYLVPIDRTDGCGTLTMRLRPARNGQRASVRFAADYEFQGAVAQLGERLSGTQKVVGSSPISSTKEPEPASPTTTVGAHEFREHFGWYLERAAAGETINVTRRGKPNVQLRGLEGQAALELASSVA